MLRAAPLQIQARGSTIQVRHFLECVPPVSNGPSAAIWVRSHERCSNWKYPIYPWGFGTQRQRMAGAHISRSFAAILLTGICRTPSDITDFAQACLHYSWYSKRILHLMYSSGHLDVFIHIILNDERLLDTRPCAVLALPLRHFRCP